MAEWRNGGVAEWRNGGMGDSGMTEWRMADGGTVEWRKGYIPNLPDIFTVHANEDDDDDDNTF